MTATWISLGMTFVLYLLAAVGLAGSGRRGEIRDLVRSAWFIASAYAIILHAGWLDARPWWVELAAATLVSQFSGVGLVAFIHENTKLTPTDDLLKMFIKGGKS